MRGRNHNRVPALNCLVAVVVASGSSNADKHNIIILIYPVNTNANTFYLFFHPTSLSQNGSVSMASSVCPVIMAAINSASPPSWRARMYSEGSDVRHTSAFRDPRMLLSEPHPSLKRELWPLILVMDLSWDRRTVVEFWSPAATTTPMTTNQPTKAKISKEK